MKTPKRYYELGHKRPDGKYNVWTQLHVRPEELLDWVIVAVVPDWKEGMEWIKRNST
jgi:hypothetical protein